MTAAVTPYASRTGRRPRTDGYVRGRQSNGYRFGSAKFSTAKRATPQPAIVVPPAAGQEVAAAGFELLQGDGTLVAWFEDLLDAVDALKAHVGPGKIVRCADRALMKSRGRP
jgi:hypothetical protein